MHIRPILASLRAHRTPAILIVLEIALACAVMCNAVFMIGQSVSDIYLPNAIDEQGITVVSLNGSDPNLAVSDIPRDLDALRRIPGVEDVGTASAVPLNSQGLSASFGRNPDARIEDTNTTSIEYYLLGEGSDKAFGLRLLQGRFFNAGEYADSTLGGELLPTTHVAIITASLANRMWPGQNPLGKVMYSKPVWYTVVGVVADVLCPDDGARSKGDQGFYYSVFFPISPGSALGYLGPGNALNNYVLRSAPKDRRRVMRDAVRKLSDLNPAALAKGQSFTEIRNQYFTDTSNMVWMLVLVCTVMLAVTAFGIVGLTSFWVQQRRRQIGIRRALGATRGHILGYFQTENFLLSTAGVVIGMVLAFGINLFLMRHYEMSLMPWYYLPASAITLWVIGQLAVLGPALRAAEVPPVVATRSV